MDSSPTQETITFVMVGCQRCGSTWVDAALREHPEIFLPSQKQTYFFDAHYDKGIDWYLNHFRDISPSQTAVGEISTGYCLIRAVPLMAKHLPHVKIIMAMRNPIDRAYSNFQVRKAVNNWSSFESALEEEPDFYERGRYIEQIEELLKHYPRKQLHLILYDDLMANDREYLKEMLTFIGVDDSFESSQIGQQRNASMFPRLRKVLHTIGLKPIVTALSKSEVGNIVRRRNKKKRKPSSSTLSTQTRATLVEYFKPYNNRLAKLLGRNLDHWNQ